MQMWFRKSKQSRRWMHRFTLCLSLDPEFYTAGITVLGLGSDDLDGALGALSLVESLDDFAEGALAEELFDLIWTGISTQSDKDVESTYIAL
jgi:hypothetical protein